jgi:para-aminobenzoate synthetase/4-amino-4-deoxychorismate lyase
MTVRAQPRADLALGVFETLLALDGEPVELEAHLSRLAASLESLYGAVLPAQASRLIVQSAGGLDLGRVRLTVAPGEHGLESETGAEAVDPGLCFPPWEAGVQLRGFRLPGGLGGHKWADRSPIPRFADGAAPLLLGGDGDVLEAGTANVFAVLDGVLTTPPTDGRILPGIARAAAIEVAREARLEVAERALAYGELLGAEEVFLTGSVRGVVPARSLDGSPLGSGDAVRCLLADALRERWRSGRGSSPAPAHAGAP